MFLIAEVKTVSPFGWKSDKSWDELFEVAARHGDMISVHTDPRWGGSFDLVKRARRLSEKPILAKGIHTTDDEVERALGAGADFVLVVGRVPKRLDDCMIEPHALADLRGLPAGARAVWNSRDLETGGRKSETVADARRIWYGWLCQASNIRTVRDVEPDVDAVLVGAHLIEFVESLSDGPMVKRN